MWNFQLKDVEKELKRIEELENARKELKKNKEEKPVSQKKFQSICYMERLCALLRQGMFCFEMKKGYDILN